MIQLHIIIITILQHIFDRSSIVSSSICLRDSSFKSLSFQQMMATPFSPPAPPALHVKAKNNFLCLINDLHLSSSLICMKELKRSSKKEGSFFEYLLSLYLNALFRLLFENADRVLQSLNLLHR